MRNKKKENNTEKSVTITIILIEDKYRKLVTRKKTGKLFYYNDK